MMIVVRDHRWSLNICLSYSWIWALGSSGINWYWNSTGRDLYFAKLHRDRPIYWVSIHHNLNSLITYNPVLILCMYRLYDEMLRWDNPMISEKEIFIQCSQNFANWFYELISDYCLIIYFNFFKFIFFYNMQVMQGDEYH